MLKLRFCCCARNLTFVSYFSGTQRYRSNGQTPHKRQLNLRSKVVCKRKTSLQTSFYTQPQRQTFAKTADNAAKRAGQ